ncbi:MAG: hypothetical protein WAM09_10280 [Anaerolineales bacterium]|jgi:hypothetical protein
MNRVKPMPDREKFQHAFDMVRLYQKRVIPFVEEQLGYAAMHELSSVWQAAMMPTREDDSDQEKYKSAYNNWLWMARCSHDYLADLLKQDEVAEYKRLLLQLYKRQQGNPDLAIYRMLKNQTALVKAWLYEMQWMTPIELTSSSDAQFICVVHDCKILQTAGTIRICRVDCRNVGTALARTVYHLNRVTTPTNHGCTISLTPLDD